MYLVLHNYYVWSYIRMYVLKSVHKVQMSLKAVHRNSLTGHEARSTIPKQNCIASSYM